MRPSGDIRDRATVQSALEGRDAVVHLAAMVGDPVSQDNQSWRVQQILTLRSR